MGVLVRTDFSAADADKHLLLRHRAAGHAARSSMAWQYVSTLDALRNDSRFAVVPCPDGPFATTDADEMETAKQGSCACKTLWWFRRALVLFPEASFIGKMEDDSVVHSARLVSELRHAVPDHDRTHQPWAVCVGLMLGLYANLMLTSHVPALPPV